MCIVKQVQYSYIQQFFHFLLSILNCMKFLSINISKNLKTKPGLPRHFDCAKRIIIPKTPNPSSRQIDIQADRQLQ